MNKELNKEIVKLVELGYTPKEARNKIIDYILNDFPNERDYLLDDVCANFIKIRSQLVYLEDIKFFITFFKPGLVVVNPSITLFNNLNLRFRIGLKVCLKRWRL